MKRRWTGFRFRFAFLLVLSTVSLLSPIGTEGQEGVADSTLAGPPIFHGSVQLDRSPLSEGMVVLHLVGGNGSGSQVDSIPLGDDGLFLFELPEAFGDGLREEVYLASISHEGILYFSAPVASLEQLDLVHTVNIFGTEPVVPGDTSIVVQARTILFEGEEQDSTVRVTDAIQLSNRGERTLVAGEDGFLWRHPLPPGASDFTVIDGQFPSDAVTVVDGELRVSAPLPPVILGDTYRGLTVLYTLPSLDATIPLVGVTDSLRLVVKQPSPTVEAGSLELLGMIPIAIDVQGLLFSGIGLRDTVVDVVQVPDPFELPGEAVLVILALGLVIAGILFVRRIPAGTSGARGQDASPRVRALLSLALLDEAFESAEAPTQGEEAAYRLQRTQLVADVSHTSPE